MNAKRTLILTFFLALSTFMIAQSYSQYMQQGSKFFDKSDYMTALERFDLAYDMANNDKEKEEAKNWKKKSKIKIRQQQTELISALKKAEEMQNNMEMAVFDRAVKNEIPLWPGYKNFTISKERDDYLKSLKKLDFSNASLIRLPDVVKQCKNLSSINLLANYGFTPKEWNKSLLSLSSMGVKEIQISVNNIDDIEKQYLSRITGIELTGKLDKFPESLLKANNLKYIDLSGTESNKNKIGKLPADFYQFYGLEKLNLNFCSIDSISPEVEKLSKLKHLELMGNNIIDLPVSIKNLTDLRYLNLSKNSRLNLPAIFELLSFSDKEIVVSTDINRKEADAKTLLVIIPENARFSPGMEIPEYLKELDLSSDQKIELDSVFSCFFGLDWNITISSDQDAMSDEFNLLIKIPDVKILPTGLANIKNLNVLDLSKNKNVNFPKVFSILKNINKPLEIHINEEADFSNDTSLLVLLPETNVLPDEICDLENLVSLSCKGNNIKSLPNRIGKLKNLTILDLSDNQLSTLPGEISKLKNLKNINLSKNKFVKFPDPVLQLEGLSNLNLSENSIKTVPDNINALRNLSGLDLSENAVEILPPTINDMTGLVLLNLTGNSISNIDVLSKVILSKTRYPILNIGNIENNLTFSGGELTENGNVNHAWSKNFSGPRDSTLAIVLHYTAAEFEGLVSYMTSPNSRSSVHFIINRDGHITQMVNTNNSAWHAGNSAFKNLKGFNSFSIGIEMVNAGSLTKSGDIYKSWYGKTFNPEQVVSAVHKNEKTAGYWENYSQEQITAVYLLCKILLKNYPGIKYILGNDEIAPGRKQDPGPAFPMDQLRDKLGLPFSGY